MNLPKRPYLFRAILDWITDNDYTPYVTVVTNLPGVVVPEEYIENNRIVLSLKPGAIIDLEITDLAITFEATFDGDPFDIQIPMNSIEALFAKEIGDGIGFPDEEYYTTEFYNDFKVEGDNSSEKKEASKEKSKKRSFLKIVK